MLNNSFIYGAELTISKLLHLILLLYIVAKTKQVYLSLTTITNGIDCESELAYLHTRLTKMFVIHLPFYYYDYYQ